MAGHMPRMLISNPTPTAPHRVASVLCGMWLCARGLASLSVSRLNCHPAWELGRRTPAGGRGQQNLPHPLWLAQPPHSRKPRSAEDSPQCLVS